MLFGRNSTNRARHPTAGNRLPLLFGLAKGAVKLVEWSFFPKTDYLLVDLFEKIVGVLTVLVGGHHVKLLRPTQSVLELCCYRAVLFGVHLHGILYSRWIAYVRRIASAD